MRPVIFWREVVATIRSQRSVSVVTWAAVAALTLTVLLTNGRTEATANQILSSIDSAGTRSVVVTLKEGAGVGTDVLDRLENVAGISWAGAFSAATDSTNIQLGDSATPVSTRTLWTRDFSPLGIADAEGAWASAHTLHQLGMIDGVGTIVDGDGTPHTISGTLETPDFLAGFEPLILLPATPSVRRGRFGDVVNLRFTSRTLIGKGVRTVRRAETRAIECLIATTVPPTCNAPCARARRASARWWSRRRAPW